MTVETERRIMKLGRTDGYRYIGIEPPLCGEELVDLPLPRTSMGGEVHERKPSVVAFGKTDGTMDLGFEAEAFGNDDELFVEYAEVLAEHIGNTALDTTVRYIDGPESVIGQFRDAPSD